MKGFVVYKFGGASLGNPKNIRQVAGILTFNRPEKLLLVVSATGKTTNKLENILDQWLEGNPARFEVMSRLIREHHELFSSAGMEEIPGMAQRFFDEASALIRLPAPESYGEAYAQLIPYGELWSSTLMADYLRQKGLPVDWTDARQLIFTNDTHRNAAIQWEETSRAAQTLKQAIAEGRIILTQGFIGASPGGTTTTLGREGSDFSAAILAAVLQAQQVVVWKDVPGIMTADPKVIPTATCIPRLSYKNAIEMTYYGAKVLHPKTIKPLENRDIPLSVKPFSNPDSPGTLISKEEPETPLPAICVVKNDQVHLEISTQDLSFMEEKNLGFIYSQFAVHQIRLNLNRVTALHMDACFDHDPHRLPGLLQTLADRFDYRIRKNLELITFISYSADDLEKIRQERNILLEEKNDRIAHLLVTPQ